MSRNDCDDDAHFLCFCGTTHVKSIAKILSVFLLLLCILLTGFGFCSNSNKIILVAGTLGCCSALLLLLLLIGVLFDKASLFLPFLVVFGIYMTMTTIMFVLYILLGTATDLINEIYDGSDWLRRIYFDLQIDVNDTQVRTITCVSLLVIAIVHSMLVIFIWTVFFLTYSYIVKAHKNSRQETGSSLSVEHLEHSPTTPLNARLYNHSIVYADSSPSDFSQQTS